MAGVEPWPDVPRRDYVWGELPAEPAVVREGMLRDGFLRVFACTWNMQGLVRGELGRGEAWGCRGKAEKVGRGLARRAWRGGGVRRECGGVRGRVFRRKVCWRRWCRGIGTIYTRTRRRSASAASRRRR